VAVARGLILVSLVAIASVLGPFTTPAAAATVSYYASPSGSGDCSTSADPCSLPAALSAAASTSGAVRVVLFGGTYGPGGFAVGPGSETSLTLVGAGAASTILSGGGADQTLDIDPGTGVAVTLASLAVENGNNTSGSGGNIYVGAVQSLTLLEVTVANGAALNGGGGMEIECGCGATVNIVNSTIADNSNVGVRLGEEASLDVSASTFSSNPDGAVAIASSASGSLVTIDDSTITGNGFGLISSAGGTDGVFGSTISGNSGPGIEADGASPPGAAIELGADVLSANSGDCSNPAPGEGNVIADAGYNFADDSSCSFSASTSNNNVSDAGLGLDALASNGGPTETMRITSASSAYDVVPIAAVLAGESATFCSGNDQRGNPRLQPGASACDAGAYQVAPPVLSGVEPSMEEANLSLILLGTNLANVTAVTFGPSQAPGMITSRSATSLLVTIPSLVPGPQPITVVNLDGSAGSEFTVVASPAVASSTLPDAVVGVSYASALSVSGGASPFAWAVASGVLPPGLTLSPAGVITGIPTAGGTFSFTVRVIDASGVFATRALSIVVTGAPALSNLRQSHFRWREGTRVATLSRRRRSARAPVGTTFSFALSEPGGVRFTFVEIVTGRRIGARCAARTRKDRRRASCVRKVNRGTLAFANGRTGTNRVIFDGLLANGRRLPLGSYAATAVATNGTGQASRPRKLRFTIVA
jgi:hypothetical protein